MIKIIKYVFVDLLRNRIVLGYTFFLLLLSLSTFTLEDNAAKGMLTLTNVILLIVPLVSILFSTIYIYNSAEFVELLVSQPLKRRTIWTSLFVGLAASLSLSFLTGAGLVTLFYVPIEMSIMILVTGLLLTIIFVAIALLAAVVTRDKAKGIGVSIFLWLYFTLFYDGLVLFLLFQFQEYPLEKAMIAATILNPIDLSRILILLKMDMSALMGFTGAVFREVFGNLTGMMVSLLILVSWITIAFWLSLRKFSRKDL